MKKLNQRGFSPLMVIAVIVVLVGVAGTGWYVMNKNKQTDESTPTPTTTSDSQSEEPVSVEENPVPDGFTEYTHKGSGFNFYYPEEWGTAKTSSPSKYSWGTEFADVTFSKLPNAGIVQLFKVSNAEFSLSAQVESICAFNTKTEKWSPKAGLYPPEASRCPSATSQVNSKNVWTFTTGALGAHSYKQAFAKDKYIIMFSDSAERSDFEGENELKSSAEKRIKNHVEDSVNKLTAAN